MYCHILHGLSDRYAQLRTWITQQWPFPTFLQVRDDLVMEELTQASSLGPPPSRGPRPPRLPLPPLLRRVRPLRHRRLFLVLFPPGGAGVGGRGGRRRGGGGRGAGPSHGSNAAPMPPHTARWPSFHNPWSGRISMWPFHAPGGEPRPSVTMLTGVPLGFPSATAWATPPGTSPRPVGWDPTAFVHSFSTMALTPPVGPDWIADSGATYHTTPDPGILSSVHPPSSSHPSSIMVANGSCLPVTFVGAAGTHGSFRVPNDFVKPSMVHNLLSIRRFTANNSCSVEFDSFGLTVKDLASRRPLLRCDITEPLYTLRFSTSAPPSSPSILSLAFAAIPSSTIWHRRLGHPGRDTLMQLSRSFDIHCTRAHDEHLCHACQLGRYVRLPFHTSSHAAHVFDLVHCDLWTSPVISISSYKYYLVVVDDFSLWIPLACKV